MPLNACHGLKGSDSPVVASCTHPTTSRRTFASQASSPPSRCKVWPHADINEALLLNHHGGRLSTRGAANILTDIANDAGLQDDFSTHVLRHTFGTNLVRGGHDLVLVAELMGHTRLETTRGYALPTTTDRENAINTLPTDR